MERDAELGKKTRAQKRGFQRDILRKKAPRPKKVVKRPGHCIRAVGGSLGNFFFEVKEGIDAGSKTIGPRKWFSWPENHKKA